MKHNAAAEDAIRDWWYTDRRQGMTSKEAAQSLLWYLAKCDLLVVRFTESERALTLSDKLTQQLKETS